jgi:outer membrane protein OmpA-like peptidoglycan-associated protein
VFVEIAKRPVPDVLVIGHTDAVGTDQVNDKLSRDRADVIRAGLIQSGIAPENIVAIGRGKRSSSSRPRTAPRIRATGESRSWCADEAIDASPIRQRRS